MKAHVIVDESGRLDRRNDDDRRVAVYVSRAHAKRVIAWLGLTGRRVRPASDSDLDDAVVCTAHCVPGWSATTAFGGRPTPESVRDFARRLKLDAI